MRDGRMIDPIAPTFYWTLIDGKDTLPEPWVFDGVRRVYGRGGVKQDRWVARALNPEDRVLAEPHEDFQWRTALVQTFGTSPGEAVNKLLDHFYPPQE